MIGKVAPLLFRLALAVSLVLPATFCVAFAASRDCDAVANKASIQFDPVLIVSLAKSKENRTCTFYVDLPSSNDGNPLQKAALEFQRLSGTKFDSVQAMQVVAQDFVNYYFSYIEYLLMKTDDSSFIKQIAEYRTLLSDCMLKSVFNRSPYAQHSQSVSCGFDVRTRSFTIAISSPQLTFSTAFPLRERA